MASRLAAYDLWVSRKKINVLYLHTLRLLVSLAECGHVHLRGTKGHGNGGEVAPHGADRTGGSAEALGFEPERKAYYYTQELRQATSPS